MILLAIIFTAFLVTVILTWRPREKESIKKVGKSSLERVKLEYEDIAFRNRGMRGLRSRVGQKRNKTRGKS